jgi:23S rRNA (guanine745-N1)-methyltransferase
LANLVKELDAIGFEALGVGIDISKEGIQIASRDYLGFIWCVADLAQNPFRDQQFDVILNLFSPANYTGFARMLHDDGVLIKVVPGRDYLRELRELFYEETERQAYSNERVIKHFSQHFQPVGTRQIRYGKELSAHDLEHLIHMTPLTWGTTEGHIQNAFRSGFLM